jgi:hypothetical protein
MYGGFFYDAQQNMYFEFPDDLQNSWYDMLRNLLTNLRIR